MQEFNGKVAVITGGGGGIGKALAEKFAEEGMKIVLADINPDTLDAAVTSLKNAGHDAIGFQTDVSDPSSVDELADRSFNAYGAVHSLCNNAGVIDAPTPMWEYTVRDWQWMFGVNFWGLINGIRSFVPRMIEQHTEGHIVNTASIDGFTFGSGPAGAIYGATKHAAVNATESLYMQLVQSGSKLRASILCPGAVNTAFIDAATASRPATMQNDTGWSELRQTQVDELRQLLLGGLTPEHVAGEVLESIRQERFYILPSPELDSFIKERGERVLARENWTPPEG